MRLSGITDARVHEHDKRMATNAWIQKSETRSKYNEYKQPSENYLQASSRVNVICRSPCSNTARVCTVTGGPEHLAWRNHDSTEEQGSDCCDHAHRLALSPREPQQQRPQIRSPYHPGRPEQMPQLRLDLQRAHTTRPTGPSHNAISERHRSYHDHCTDAADAACSPRS